VYVGKTAKTLEERIQGHLDAFKYPRESNRNYVIYKAMRKYGWDSFKFEILDSAENEKELNEKEIHWIKELNSKIPNGYNMTDGGEGRLGTHHTEETREKISKSKLGSTPWNKGKSGIYSDETRRSISETLRRSHAKNGVAKIVINETTGERFVGLREASEAYGVHKTSIYRACKKVPGKSRVKGCYWRFEDDETESKVS